MSFESGVQAGASLVNTARRAKQERLANHIAGYDYNTQSGQYEANDYGRQVEATKMQQARTMQGKSQVDQYAYNEQLETMKKLDQLQAQQARQQASINAKDIKDATMSMIRGNAKDAQTILDSNPELKDKLANSSIDIVQIAPIDWYNDGDLIQEQLIPKTKLNLTPESMTDPDIVGSMDRNFVKVMGKNGKWRIVGTQGIIDETNGMQYMRDSERAEVVQHYNDTMNIWRGKGLLTPKEKRLKDSTIKAEQNLVDKTGLPPKVAGQVAANSLSSDHATYNSMRLEEFKQNNRKELLELKQKADTSGLNTEAVQAGYMSLAPKTGTSTEAIETVIEKLDKGERLTKEEEVYLQARQGSDRNAKLPVEIASKHAKMQGVAKTALKFMSKVEAMSTDKQKKLFDSFNKIRMLRDKIELTFKKDEVSKEEIDSLTSRISTDSTVSTLVSQYLLAISGTAVSQEERVNVINAMTGGDWITSLPAFKAAMSTWAKAVVDIGYETMKGALSSRAPLEAYRLAWSDRQVLRELEEAADTRLFKGGTNTNTNTNASYTQPTVNIGANPNSDGVISSQSTKPSAASDFFKE